MKVLHLLWSGTPGGIETLILSIVKKNYFQNEVCFVHKGGVIADEINRLNIKVYCLNAGSGYDITIVKKLFHIVKKGNYSIINIHNSALATVCAILTGAFFPNVHIVCSEHGAIACKPKKEILLDHIIKRFIKYHIAVSNSVKNELVERYKLKPGLIRVIHNGVDTEEFCKYPGPKPKGFVIGYVGRLVREKGVDILIQAFKLFCSSLSSDNASGVKLVVVGDGPEKPYLAKLAQACEMEERIEFLGYRRDICKILNEFDLFIYPSVCEEAFGISVVEAMAAGLPTIVFNRGGLPEIIENNVDGFIVDRVNHEALYNEISRVYKVSREGLLYPVSLKARKKAKEIFNINNTVKELRDYYSSACGEKALHETDKFASSI